MANSVEELRLQESGEAEDRLGKPSVPEAKGTGSRRVQRAFEEGERAEEGQCGPRIWISKGGCVGVPCG